MLPPRLTPRFIFGSLIKRFVSMVTLKKRSKIFSIEEHFKNHIKSVRSNCVSSLRTQRASKHSHRRSTTGTMVNALCDSLFSKPMQRSFSLCSLTSDEFYSDDENDPYRLNVQTSFDTLSREASPSMNPPRIPTTALRMRPSHYTEQFIEYIPFPPLAESSKSPHDGDSSASAAIGIKTESRLDSDCIRDDEVSVPILLEYGKTLNTYDTDLYDFVLDTPKPCYLHFSLESLSPPPLLVAKRNIIYPDDFDNDCTTTNQALFLPDAF